jgi:hypothetical protein
MSMQVPDAAARTSAPSPSLPAPIECDWRPWMGGDGNWMYRRTPTSRRDRRCSTGKVALPDTHTSEGSAEREATNRHDHGSRADFPHVRPSVTSMLASVAPRLRQATVTCSYPNQVTIYNCRISTARARRPEDLVAGRVDVGIADIAVVFHDEMASRRHGVRRPYRLATGNVDHQVPVALIGEVVAAAGGNDLRARVENLTRLHDIPGRLRASCRSAHRHLPHNAGRPRTPTAHIEASRQDEGPQCHGFPSYRGDFLIADSCNLLLPFDAALRSARVHTGRRDRFIDRGDGNGGYGETLDIAFRLLDAPARQSRPPNGALLLVISSEIYNWAVRHGSAGVDHAAFRRLVTAEFVNRRRLTAYRADIGTPPGARPCREAKVAASIGAYETYEKIISPGPGGSDYAARLGTADSTLAT